MISRLGFKPAKRQTIKSDLLRSTEEVTIIIPVKDNQNGIDLFLTEFFTTHTADNFLREIFIVDNNSSPKIGLRQTDFPTALNNIMKENINSERLLCLLI